MMMFVGDFLELRDVEHSGKLVKVKHRLVFAVLAKIADIFAEPHIFQMIRNKTAVATLHSLAVFLLDFIALVRFHY